MATNAGNVEASRWPIPQSSRMSCGQWRQNDPPHTCSRLQTLQDRRLDVTLAARALTICRKLLLFLPFNTNNQCYSIFNRLDSPNKGKYF